MAWSISCSNVVLPPTVPADMAATSGGGGRGCRRWASAAAQKQDAHGRRPEILIFRDQKRTAKDGDSRGQAEAQGITGPEQI